MEIWKRDIFSRLKVDDGIVLVDDRVIDDFLRLKNPFYFRHSPLGARVD